jgi:hypothetical protein
MCRPWYIYKLGLRFWGLPLRWLGGPETITVIPRAHVLILGSYTDSALRRLRACRDYLIDEEHAIYSRLVMDFATPQKTASQSDAEYNEWRSRYWIEHADIVVCIFVSRADQGLTHELDYMLSRVEGIASRTVIAISRSAYPTISSLVKSQFSDYLRELTFVGFKSRKELHDGLSGALYNLCDLTSMHMRVTNRPVVGEWEQSTPSSSSAMTAPALPSPAAVPTPSPQGPAPAESPQ